MTSEIITVHLQKSEIVIPDGIGYAFAKAGHKRIQLTTYHNDKKVVVHAALRRVEGIYRVYFGKGYQKELGITADDSFTVQLKEDISRYGVIPPAAFTAVYETDLEGAQLFEQLTDGQKRSLIFQIKRYRTEQTQVDKMLILFENLKRGLRDPRHLFKSF